MAKGISTRTSAEEKLTDMQCLPDNLKDRQYYRAHRPGPGEEAEREDACHRGVEERTEEGKMNRRTLLSHLGKAAAVTISPSILGASPLPRSTDYSLAPPADILNGSSLLRFYKGDSGLALELCHPADRTIAAINYPVRVFYDRRGNDSERNMEFTSVLPVGGGWPGHIHRTHRRAAQPVVCEAECGQVESGRLPVPSSLQTAGWEARNVFFEHSMVPDLAASPDDTYVLMPGLLYEATSGRFPWRDSPADRSQQFPVGHARSEPFHHGHNAL